MEVLLERQTDHVALVRIDHPEARNALTPAMRGFLDRMPLVMQAKIAATEMAIAVTGTAMQVGGGRVLDDNDKPTAEHTYWKGFGERTAKGLSLMHAAPSSE